MLKNSLSILLWEDLSEMDLFPAKDLDTVQGVISLILL